MNRARTAPAIVATCLALSLGACSSDDTGSALTQPVRDVTAAPADTSFVSGGDLADARARELQELADARDRMLATPQTVEVAPSCEEFNAVMAEARGATSDDYDGAVYSAYLRAMDAKQVAPDETFRLFDTASRLMTERMLGDASQETIEAVGDAVSDADAACAAAGVTLVP
ncbi:hypothetical protein [Sanguibacter sp. 25GB23B1]|uniref:hypothetical protein n=1 Tax=unclassified Sanguibacter TaxID=2645534 RepID=UPI0032AF0C3D